MPLELVRKESYFLDMVLELIEIFLETRMLAFRRECVFCLGRLGCWRSGRNDWMLEPIVIFLRFCISGRGKFSEWFYLLQGAIEDCNFLPL